MKSAWKKLRPARLAACVRQVDLAAALECTQVTVSKRESGKLPVSLETVARILSAIEALSTARGTPQRRARRAPRSLS